MGAVSLLVHISLRIITCHDPVIEGAFMLTHTPSIFRCLTQTYPQPPRFTQLVLCEPMVAPTDIPNGDPMVAVSNTLISATEVRRDVWPSLENASSTLKARKAFAVWDDDVFRLYLVRFSITPIPYLLTDCPLVSFG